MSLQVLAQEHPAHRNWEVNLQKLRLRFGPSLVLTQSLGSVSLGIWDLGLGLSLWVLWLEGSRVTP